MIYKPFQVLISLRYEKLNWLPQCCRCPCTCGYQAICRHSTNYKVLSNINWLSIIYAFVHFMTLIKMADEISRYMLCMHRKYQSITRAHNYWVETTSFLTLTHWGQDKMAAIFQTTLSNAFSWMKMYKFRFRFVFNGPINNIPTLRPARRQTIIWTNDVNDSDAYMRHSTSMSYLQSLNVHS